MRQVSGDLIGPDQKAGDEAGAPRSSPSETQLGDLFLLFTCSYCTVPYVAPCYAYLKMISTLLIHHQPEGSLSSSLGGLMSSAPGSALMVPRTRSGFSPLLKTAEAGMMPFGLRYLCTRFVCETLTFTGREDGRTQSRVQNRHPRNSPI